MAVATGVSVAFSGTTALADTGTADISFSPMVNFSSLFTSLMTTLGPIVAGALGVGVALWGVSMIWKVFRKFARGGA